VLNKDCLYFSSDLTCIYKSGEGIGKREYRVGRTKSQFECSSRCIVMKKRRSDVNGVMYSARYRACYCIGKMQGRRRSNLIWRSCFLVEKNAITTQTVPEISQLFKSTLLPYGVS